MKKKIAILSYYFPPMGMGGTQRVAKFSKYLPEFGWQPFIFTVKPVFYYAQDASLLNELKQIPIYRTGSLDPLRLLQLLKNYRSTPHSKSPGSNKPNWKSSKLLKFFNDVIGGWLLIPDTKVLWLPFVIFRAWRVIRKEQIGIIFTTSPPQSVHLAGLILKKLLGVKWVADFRDEWTGGESQANPTRLHRLINQSMERAVLRSADAVTGISDMEMQNLKTRAGSCHTRFTTIRNGFDGADMQNPTGLHPGEKFTILHCGSLSKVSKPGPFLAAVAQIFEKNPAMRKKIRIQFVGTDIFGQLTPLIEQFQLKDEIEIIGYVPHHEAVKKLFQAHVLLLLVIQTSQEEIVTGKVFEYLASGRPILAMIPPGELAEMIQAANAGTILDFQDGPQIEHAILKYYTQFIGQTLPNQPDKSVNQFERKNLTEVLAKILNRLSEEGDSIES